MKNRILLLISTAVLLGACQMQEAKMDAPTGRMSDVQAKKEALNICKSLNVEENAIMSYGHWVKGISRERSREILSQGRKIKPGTAGDLEVRLPVKHGYSSSSPEMAALSAFSECVGEYVTSIRKNGR